MKLRGWVKPAAVAGLVLFGAGMLQTFAGGHGRYGWYHGHRHYNHGGWGWSGISFTYGSPYYWGAPVYVGPSYASAYTPVFGDYVSRRPNYAVGGTLLGALAGGLIGNSIHHQGWEGAGIGAAAGLVLGTLAEHRARVQEQRAYDAALVTNSQQSYVPDAATAPVAPVAPPAPTVRVQTAAPPGSGAMSRANSLFGR